MESASFYLKPFAERIFHGSFFFEPLDVSVDLIRAIMHEKRPPSELVVTLETSRKLAKGQLEGTSKHTRSNKDQPEVTPQHAHRSG